MLCLLETVGKSHENKYYPPTERKQKVKNNNPVLPQQPYNGLKEKRFTIIIPIFTSCPHFVGNIAVEYLSQSWTHLT